MDHQIGYGVEVTGLSPSVTEKDLIDFFSFSGTIEYIDIVRSGEQACTAYVMFRDSYSQETAVLLSGATILDQRVCITRWGQHHEEFDFWNATPRGFEDESYSHPHAQRGEFNAGEAVTKAQEVVKSMLATGFVLGKDALSKAKTFDESHGVSAAAMARVSQLEQRIGLTDKIFTGLEAVRMTDQRYHVSDTAKSAISATGRTAAAAATSVVNSSYFSNGALWLSGALERAAKAASDLGNHGSRQ
ncbi:PREDICTED: binding partner of ACD11 1 [Camelina sativa]|uniref:Binding partner of ACD11 1 n=1 Tax=Camelina sativa TaxID=90675 RepID=A0ABM0WUS7_CAMSA|nr:PREDICTED: binding partner of ACD11 1 [Camelina sativa]